MLPSRCSHPPWTKSELSAESTGILCGVASSGQPLTGAVSVASRSWVSGRLLSSSAGIAPQRCW